MPRSPRGNHRRPSGLWRNVALTGGEPDHLITGHIEHSVECSITAHIERPRTTTRGLPGRETAQNCHRWSDARTGPPIPDGMSPQVGRVRIQSKTQLVRWLALASSSESLITVGDCPTLSSHLDGERSEGFSGPAWPFAAFGVDSSSRCWPWTSKPLPPPTGL